MIRAAVLAALAYFLAPAQAMADDTLLERRLEAHIDFLASDLLRGRQPGTPGHEIAAAYVASQFAQAGLSPAGERGGWYQQVPMRRAHLEEGSATLELSNGTEARVLDFIDQFYTGPSLDSELAEVTAPAVFAGYGIHAPELGYSDYEGLDVAGRVVVILSGMPAHFPSEQGAHFASYREKARAAIERGAFGLVRVHTPRRDRRVAWARYASVVGTPSMGWLDETGTPFASTPQLRVNAVVHHSAAALLFEEAPATLDELIALDEAGDALPVFALDADISASRRSRHDVLTSPNVVGMLRGSDPMLNDEFVVYVAHLDHIGELHNAEPGEDAINNGALDNASGVSVMLETARAFAAAAPPRRSLLFIAVTAEEKGLVGSEYFAQNPTVPADSLTAVINLDMPLLLYDFGDVIAFGAERSTLGDSMAAAAADHGVALTPDPMPEQNIFVRSDHYRFVQRGIPSIFLVTGRTARDGVTDVGPVFDEFLKTHYHQPTDAPDLPIDYTAAVRFTRINQSVGERVANDPERPNWVEGDFFGRLYARERPENSP